MCLEVGGVEAANCTLNACVAQEHPHPVGSLLDDLPFDVVHDVVLEHYVCAADSRCAKGAGLDEIEDGLWMDLHQICGALNVDGAHMVYPKNLS